MVSWLTISCLESPYISSSSCLKKQERGPTKSLLDDDEPSTKLPKAVFLGRKAVSFETECLVTEYDVDLTPGQRSCMWWEAVELDRFRFKRQKRHQQSDPSKYSSSPGSSASPERQQHHGSHPQQVVFLYEAYKGTEKGSELLGQFSRRLSKRARKKAYQRAVMLSKSTGTYGPTTPYPMNRNRFFPLTSRITDFYIESLLETVEQIWLCGVWGGTDSVKELSHAGNMTEEST